MKLYIGNTSTQKVDFVFRLPDNKARRHQQSIPQGTQIMVLNDHITMEQAQSIVDQHAKYGLIEASTIDHRKPFVGLCYSFDRPITHIKMANAIEHNMHVREKASRDERVLNAAALATAIDKATPQGMPRITQIELGTLEQNGPSEPGINEAVLFQRNPDNVASTGRFGRRAGRRRAAAP